MISHPKETFCVTRLLPLKGRNMCDNGFNSTKIFFCLGCEQLYPQSKQCHDNVNSFFLPPHPPKKPVGSTTISPPHAFFCSCWCFSLLWHASFSEGKEGGKEPLLLTREKGEEMVCTTTIYNFLAAQLKKSKRSNIRHSTEFCATGFVQITADFFRNTNTHHYYVPNCMFCEGNFFVEFRAEMDAWRVFFLLLLNQA